MKWKAIIILMMLAFLLSTTSAFADNCKETLEIESNCTMITPVINCTNYTYIIYNETGAGIELGNLTNFNDSIYYFNFTLGEGGYVIEICDGSTREVLVTTDREKMIIGAMILMSIIMIFFGYLGYLLFRQYDTIFHYISYVLWYLALLIPLFAIRMIADSPGTSSNLEHLLNSFYTIYLYFYYFMVVMFVVYLIILVLTWVVKTMEIVPGWKKRQQKQQQEQQNNGGSF